MKQVSLAALAVFGFATASEAEGISYHGAEANGRITYNFGSFGSSTRGMARGTAQFDFNGSDFFVQPEAALNSFNITAFGGSVGTHVGMDLNPDTAAGVFVMYNGFFPNFFGTPDFAFGPEVKGKAGNVTYEVFAAGFANPGGIYGGTLRGDAWLPLGGRWTAGAGLGVLNAGGPTFLQGTLRACYALSDGLNLEAGYTLSTDGAAVKHGLAVMLTFSNDRGITFGPRDFLSLRRDF